MNIGVLLERDYPTTPEDIRVSKELRSLMHAGHNIYMLSLKISDRPDEEEYQGIVIRRVGIPMLCIRDWCEENVESHFNSPESPWIPEITRFIHDYAIDSIHVHDLPLAGSALIAGKMTGLPVLLDLHESYPQLVDFMRARNREGWCPVSWVEVYEKKCIKAAAHIIVTVDEAKMRLNSLGVADNKITVIQNTELAGLMVPAGGNLPTGKTLTLTYVGAFGEIRGLDELIEAAAILLHDRMNIEIVLVGGGYNEGDLKLLAHRKEIGDHVTFTGWVDFSQVPDYISRSDICLVPHKKTPFTDTTIPHKLFQYMLMAKPVVVSDAAPLKRIVGECRCGEVYTSGNVEELADILAGLAVDAGLRDIYGRNGRKAAITKYNWSVEERKLITLYETFADC